MRRAFRGPGRVQASGLEAPIHPPRGPFGAPTRAPVPSQAVAAAIAGGPAPGRRSLTMRFTFAAITAR